MLKLDNKSSVPDKVIEDAFNFVLLAIMDFEMNQRDNTNFDPGGLIVKVWNLQEGKRLLKKDWSGWAFWNGNIIDIWVNEKFEVSIQGKNTLLGKKLYPIVGVDGLLVTAFAHEISHIYFREHVHPITEAVEVAVARKYWSTHGPGYFKTLFALLRKQIRRI